MTLADRLDGEKEEINNQVETLKGLTTIPRRILPPLVVVYMRHYGLDTNTAITSIRKDLLGLKD